MGITVSSAVFVGPDKTDASLPANFAAKFFMFAACIEVTAAPDSCFAADGRAGAPPQPSPEPLQFQEMPATVFISYSARGRPDADPRGPRAATPTPRRTPPVS